MKFRAKETKIFHSSLNILRKFFMKIDNCLYSAKFYKFGEKLIVKNRYYHPYFWIKCFVILIIMLIVGLITYGATVTHLPDGLFISIPKGAKEIKGKENISAEIDLFYKNKKLDIDNTKYV